MKTKINAKPILGSKDIGKLLKPSRSLAHKSKGFALRIGTVAKFGEQSPNEDYAYGDEGCIALSDGAGGCGLYADRWSKYLVTKLDKNKPIESYEQLDTWVDGIWQAFYDECEAEARRGDAMLLNKFYSEGSCATLVAAWLLQDNQCHWLAYGDSLLFVYNRERGELWHSFTSLADFDKSPYLISCKDPLTEQGFSRGVISLDENSIIFAASDALSHFILMMYQVSKRSEYQEEIDALMHSHNSSSHLVQVAQAMSYRFYEDIIEPLIASTASETAFARQMRSWYDSGLLELDDYTIVFLRK